MIWAAAAVGAEAAEVGSVLYPRIVNGSVSNAYPATGALLVFEDAAASVLYGLCSGTLIGCHTFLTAAHCVCSENASNARECTRDGLTDPATMRIFLQHGGVYRAASVAITSDYSFAEHGDLAVITLAGEVTGVAPVAINAASKPAYDTAGIIVGFGRSDAGFRSANDAGVKREGSVTTAQCGEDIPDGTNVCWDFSGTRSNVCSGDSGGPLFVDIGAGLVVAGVTSGSYSFDCEPPDMSFDSDVSGYSDWIAQVAGADLGTASCGLPAPGSGAVKTTTKSGQMSSRSKEARVTFDVPAGTARLRVGLNGQMGSGSDFFQVSNDFDLYIRAGEPPTTSAYDCADTNSTTFGFCDIEAPRAGTWHALVNQTEGEGVYQLTVTTYAVGESSACEGDCDADGMLDTADLLAAVDAALRDDGAEECSSADRDGDGSITVDEIIAAADRQGPCPTP